MLKKFVLGTAAAAVVAVGALAGADDAAAHGKKFKHFHGGIYGHGWGIHIGHGHGGWGHGHGHGWGKYHCHWKKKKKWHHGHGHWHWKKVKKCHFHY